MRNYNDRNDWSDMNNKQGESGIVRGKGKDEQRKQKQTQKTKQTRQETKSDQCTQCSDKTDY